MNNMIVLGHGQFASGLQYALGQIIGEQENVVFLNFPESKSPAELKQEILAAIESFDCQSHILFCCDILGGSPFRVASLVAKNLVKSEVITGTNLQMLVECCMEKDELDFYELVELAICSGKQGIVKLSEQLANTKVNTVQQDDGI
ncbi:PTS system N-acetylgalactosamine-specific EIIA component (Man family) [Nicoletella semolina]|uniref:PTS system N-acetylgalactosamine-specific EIIA component (Man family) n=1 Tax=Nicoletella semolina TaxID=271160 RepID=A0A4R2N5X0_9PAST|nr:PTS galactosamine/N-acetylgalactosamine transporter subunit IIA [Nicoletella semolina]MDH2925139.1 hypothetical protein [Nicoletella semolina]TCP16237.1 PTS system N-acetylgalactosamine-specific EIIA component (Man family) [Nicoletella semolina]